MPLPKAPTKLATQLTDIPPIPKPKRSDTKKVVAKPVKAVPNIKLVSPPSALLAGATVAPVQPWAKTATESSTPINAFSSDARKPHPRKKTSGRKGTNPDEPKKMFVLDTNVLMHDPTSLFRFEEHDVFLPLITLEELDNHKKGMTEVARHARQVSRNLDLLLEDGPSRSNASGKAPQVSVPSKDSVQDVIKGGIPLNKLGNADALGKLYVQTSQIDGALPSTLPVGKADNQILSVVNGLAKQLAPMPVVLVSKDINMRIKARALGMLAEDYFNDQVLEDTDLLYSGILPLPNDFWDKHGKGVESWQQGGSTYYRVTGPIVAHMLVNQFVFCEAGIPLVAQVKEVQGRTAVLQTLRDYSHNKNAVWGVTARNREQNFAINLLMNPECDFVSILGQAGTGKTLLTLAAGLAQTLESKLYSEIIVTRATVPVGEDIGFLPGTEEEKMAPWMGALEDNLEVLNKSDTSVGDWGRSATQDLIRTKIRIKSMNFMRGRTFVNKFLIIDEAQNLTPKQMKTLITRAGPGTKVVCLGNIAQIDTPYLTEGSSGLTFVVDRFKGWGHAGHITLQRGERSRLADFAAEVL